MSSSAVLLAKGRNGEIMMRAMRAKSFTGYGGLKLVEVPRPRRADGRVLVRITAAGVTPLDTTILSGGYPRATAPLILGNEGAGVVEDPGDSVFSGGDRVMFAGPYGVSEDGTYSEWITVRAEDLCLIPDNIDDATAGGMPVAYLTAQITLTQAGFEPGKTVLAPAIGGAVGNAVTQLARAQGAAKAISTTTNPAKAERAPALGFDNVIDLSEESLTDGVARLTGGRGVDVVIDRVGGALTGHALATLAVGGVLTSLGYAAGPVWPGMIPGSICSTLICPAFHRSWSTTAPTRRWSAKASSSRSERKMLASMSACVPYLKASTASS